MPEPHKRPSRHPKYRTAYRVRNWHEYEQSLRDRGDITLWISPEAIAAWRALMSGKRGAQPMYADIAIETALALRLLFHLPRRQTEGLLGAVLRLMGVRSRLRIIRRCRDAMRRWASGGRSIMLHRD